MTGRLRVEPADRGARAPHARRVPARGRRRAALRRRAPLRLGRTGAALRGVARAGALGPDPLTALDAPALAAALAGARTPIKAFLMDQRRIAGLGNIYVAEALFRAGIHPAAPARRVRGARG